MMSYNGNSMRGKRISDRMSTQAFLSCFVACALLTACGDSTNQGIDPIVRIVNQSGQAVYFEWRDGQSVIGRDTVLAGARACESFLARADSAYFYAQMLGGPMTDTYTQPWFDPSERHAWTMTVTNAGGFLVSDVRDPAC